MELEKAQCRSRWLQGYSMFSTPMLCPCFQFLLLFHTFSPSPSGLSWLMDELHPWLPSDFQLMIVKEVTSEPLLFLEFCLFADEDKAVFYFILEIFICSGGRFMWIHIFAGGTLIPSCNSHSFKVTVSCFIRIWYVVINFLTVMQQSIEGGYILVAIHHFANDFLSTATESLL